MRTYRRKAVEIEVDGEKKKVEEPVVAANPFICCRQPHFDVMDDGEVKGERNYLILELAGGGESVLMVARRASDRAIAFVQNARACDDMAPYLVLPGGLKNHPTGETLDAAARRELYEEIDLVAKGMAELGIINIHPLVRDSARLYLVDDCTPPAKNDYTLPQLDPETLAVQWLDEGEIHDAILRGKISDGQTLAALMMLHAHDEKSFSQVATGIQERFVAKLQTSVNPEEGDSDKAMRPKSRHITPEYNY